MLDVLTFIAPSKNGRYPATCVRGCDLPPSLVQYLLILSVLTETYLVSEGWACKSFLISGNGLKVHQNLGWLGQQDLINSTSFLNLRFAGKSNCRKLEGHYVQRQTLLLWDAHILRTPGVSGGLPMPDLLALHIWVLFYPIAQHGHTSCWSLGAKILKTCLLSLRNPSCVTSKPFLRGSDRNLTAVATTA